MHTTYNPLDKILHMIALDNQRKWEVLSRANIISWDIVFAPSTPSYGFYDLKLFKINLKLYYHKKLFLWSKARLGYIGLSLMGFLDIGSHK